MPVRCARLTAVAASRASDARLQSSAADATISKWTISDDPSGKPTLDFYRPAVPGLEPLDDRPGLVAKANGAVLFMGMAGEQHAYPGSTGSQGASIVHMSYDGGETFALVDRAADADGGV